MPNKTDSYLIVIERILMFVLLAVLSIHCMYHVPAAVVLATFCVYSSISTILLVRMFNLVRNKFR